MAGYIRPVIALKDPAPGRGRWSQAIEWFWSGVALNVVFNTVLLGWLLDVPIWSRYVCLVACFVAALFIDVIAVSWRRTAPPTLDIAQGSTTNPDAAAVTYHSRDRVT